MSDEKLIGNDDLAWNNVFSQNTIITQKFQAIASGSMTTIKIKGAVGMSGNVMVALYSDNAGTPNTLLTSSGSTAIIAGWNTISLPPITITKNSYYWLAYNQNTPVVSIISGVGSLKYKGGYTFSGFSFPNPAPSGFSSLASSIALAGWGTASPAGCPRQAMHMRRLM